MKLVLKIFKIKYTKNNFKKKYQEFILEEKYPKLLKTIINFINLFKSFNYSNDYFQKIIKKALKKEQYFLLITYSIYLDYNNELSSLGLIDFNDMLIKACNLNFNLKYKYIIVDEYQDTSLVRYQLLKAIIQKTNAKLMVVGDDYQSIYHFSGCTLEIFINFAKYFKQAKILYLNTTYRNSQELVDVATDFIRQNKKQIPKEMISLNHHFKPIKLVYYHNLKKDLTSLI